MRLLPCPACGRDVSDQAEACPKCGHPLARRPQPRRVQETESRSLPNNDTLSWWGNLVSMYCLVLSPTLWIMENLHYFLDLIQDDPDKIPFLGFQIIFGVVDALVGFTLVVLLAWGGVRLRNLSPSARPMLLTGFSIKIGWSMLMCPIAIGIGVVLADNDNDQPQALGARDVLSFLMFGIGLLAFVFEVVTLIWLIAKPLPFRRMPSDESDDSESDEHDSHSIKKPSAKSVGKTGGDYMKSVFGILMTICALGLCIGKTARIWKPQKQLQFKAAPDATDSPPF